MATINIDLSRSGIRSTGNFTFHKETIPSVYMVPFSLEKEPVQNSETLTLNGQVLSSGINGDYKIENKIITILMEDIVNEDLLILAYTSTL
jgi:hypothetical protein